MKKKIIIGVAIVATLAFVAFLFYRKSLQNKVMEAYDLTEYQVGKKSISELKKMIKAWSDNQNKGGA